MSDPFASVAHASDVGRWREHNEDAVRVDERAGLLVLADGMGGHAAGEVASGLAADTVVAAVAREGHALAEALYGAHGAVLQATEEGRGAPGMGTTCVACRLQAGELEVAWVGDSRAYLFREGALRSLSRDHSYVQGLVDAGVLDAAAAARHPERHVLARCIGGGALARDEVDSHRLAVAAGDRVLLCSDGLTDELDDDGIAALLGRYPEDHAAVEALIEAALAAGGRDNVTVVVATVA